MNLELIITLMILVGFFSSVVGSLVGLGGGMTAIPLIILIIGEHNLEAKLISYVNIAVLGIISLIKYKRQGRSPEWTYALLVGVGVMPATILTELYVAPILTSSSWKAYFHIFYALVLIFVILLINFKEKLRRGVAPKWSLPFAGLFVGSLAGSIGLSGGVIFVPLFVVGLHFSLKKAAVTSLLLKFSTASINIIVAASSGQYGNMEANGVYWFLPLIIIIGSIAGSLVGPIISKKVTNNQIQIIFNCVMISLTIWEIIDFVLMITNLK